MHHRYSNLILPLWKFLDWNETHPLEFYWNNNNSRWWAHTRIHTQLMTIDWLTHRSVHIKSYQKVSIKRFSVIRSKKINSIFVEFLTKNKNSFASQSNDSRTFPLWLHMFVWIPISSVHFTMTFCSILLQMGNLCEWINLKSTIHAQYTQFSSSLVFFFSFRNTFLLRRSPTEFSVIIF